MNRTLNIYKISTLGFCGLALILTTLAFYQSTADPVVVLEKCGNRIVQEGKREALQVTDSDVVDFIEQWVRLRYTWTSAAPDKVLRAIEPISTKGLQSKLADTLAKRQAKQTPGQKEQKIEEIATNVRVTLTEKEALAAFDRIVRINGIPIVIPSEVSLQITEGRRTHWNPFGLYVNGVLEHEER